MINWRKDLHLTRSREIASVLIGGWDYLLHNSEHDKLNPKHTLQHGPPLTRPEHLRSALQELGTTFIKLGQIRSWFRFYSVGTILILVALAILAFSYVPEVAANQPTPWFGLSERISQFAHGLWHAVLAIVLLTEQSAQRAA